MPIAAALPPSTLDTLWFTRCPVPTASGIAFKLGWLGEEFARDGIRVATLQDALQLGRHHYDHELPGLFREGGNVPALAARGAGTPTRLIGLTWIEEWQTITCAPTRAFARPPTCAASAWPCRLGKPATAPAASPEP